MRGEPILRSAVVPTIPRAQRDVAGRQFLSRAELNALYCATYQLRRPRGWKEPHSVGQYWRSAIVLLFNYGLDTGTIWKTKTTHQPLLWRHVFWNHESPIKATIPLRLAILPTSENEQIVLSTNEPCCPRASATTPVLHLHSRGTDTCWRNCTAQQCLQAARRARRDPRKSPCQNRCCKRLVAEGSAQDMCDLLRRAHARVRYRSSRSLSRRSHLSALSPLRSSGVQSNHDNSTALRLHGSPTGNRGRVSVLSAEVQRIMILRSMKPERTRELISDALVSGSERHRCRISNRRHQFGRCNRGELGEEEPWAVSTYHITF